MLSISWLMENKVADHGGASTFEENSAQRLSLSKFDVAFYDSLALAMYFLVKVLSSHGL